MAGSSSEGAMTDEEVAHVLARETADQFLAEQQAPAPLPAADAPLPLAHAPPPAPSADVPPAADAPPAATFMQVVDFIREELSIASEDEPPDVLEKANELMGLPSNGPLLSQANALLEAFGVDKALQLL